MNLTKRKLILVLVFVLVGASLLRVLKITINTSYYPTLEHGPKTINLSPSTYDNKVLSQKELKFLSGIILQKSPCNLLVFGLEDQYLKLPTINIGGKTVFLEEEPEKLMKVKNQVNGTQITDLQCKIGLTGFPKEVLKTKWDIIVVDGPSGDGPESPGRMGAIYMAGVLARAGNGTNVVVHDVDRTIEKWFSWEFLSEKNLVSSKGRFWNFMITQNKKLGSSKTY
ncbi:hypothetical protein CTI12_AA565200 [Artemisia annua]|uniref:Polysaccharide biosynthesis domain-containing protein n=1 Tax=Artemisia annua TaxID=35608 RepID=A0A2U1KTW8_ARTAN|nr:hypothetical protein CTI12_AA565200 [Artemisia annua]